MSLVKYRLKEVAQDFGVAPKEIAEIVAKFTEKPKSNTQVLTPEELNCVFDYMTQKNPISDLSVVFAAAAPKAAPAPAPKAEAPKADPKPQQQANRPQQQNNQPKAAPQQQTQQQKPAKPAEPERKRERRVVDTSAVQVNANRFADVDNLVSERVQNYQGGKQKFGKKVSSRIRRTISSRATRPVTRSRRSCAVCRWKWPARLPPLLRFPTRSPSASWLPA